MMDGRSDADPKRSKPCSVSFIISSPNHPRAGKAAGRACMENRSRADLSPPIEEVSELVGVPTIGPIRADILESVGIRTVGQPASCKPDILLTGSPATLVRDPSFPYQIPLALSYAKAISQRKPILTPH